MKEIEAGQIWEITTDNFLTGEDKKHFNRQLKLNKGEKIEIRFPFAWNFRTEQEDYFHCPEGVIHENCKLIGKIWSKVKFQNQAKLEEILRLNLYDII